MIKLLLLAGGCYVGYKLVLWAYNNSELVGALAEIIEAVGSCFND